MNSIRPLKLITWVQLSLALVCVVCAINATHESDKSTNVILTTSSHEPGVGATVNSTTNDIYPLEESRKRELAREVQPTTDIFTLWIAAAALLMFGGPTVTFIYVASRMTGGSSVNAEDNAGATLSWELHAM